MARTRRLHRSGSSGLRSPILKRHRNLKALRLRLVAARQPFGPFCTACRRKRRWTCSKERHPGRLRTRQQIRPKSWRGWCSSNTRLLNRSRARVARSKVTFFVGRCRSTRTLSLKDRRGGLRIQSTHRPASTPKACIKKTWRTQPRPRYRPSMPICSALKDGLRSPVLKWRPNLRVLPRDWSHRLCVCSRSIAIRER